MDRAAAVGYAFKFWDRPCDDGVIWQTNKSITVSEARRVHDAPAADGWEARFIPNGAGTEDAAFIKPNPAGTEILGLSGKWDRKIIAPWIGLADCTHYISRCLSAGKVNGVSALMVAELVSKLQALPDTKTLVQKVSQAAAERVIKSGIFKQGDIIGYGGEKDYTHSTMYLGAELITCHSLCRFGTRGFYKEKWDLAKGYLYTLIHFTAEDAAPAPATQNLLDGWWEIEFEGRLYYYHFNRNGTVQWGYTKPQSKTTPMFGAQGRAYWFQRGTDIVYFWRTTGTAETLHLAGTSTNLKLDVNGVAGSKARKLF